MSWIEQNFMFFEMENKAKKPIGCPTRSSENLGKNRVECWKNVKMRVIMGHWRPKRLKERYLIFENPRYFTCLGPEISLIGCEKSYSQTENEAVFA